MKMIYFIRPVGCVGPIKIGCSVAPEGRMNTMLGWSPIPLEIAACAPGENADEAALHHRFASLALHGEWFGVDGDLAAVIEEVAETGKLPSLAPAPTSTTNRCIASIKSRLTKEISTAEEHAFGFRMNLGTGRPEHIWRIIDGISGPFATVPTPQEQQALVQYVADLRSKPRFAKRWQRGWDAWVAYRDGPNGLSSLRRPRPTAGASL